MKILITGSNGLLGQKIIYALLKINASDTQSSSSSSDSQSSPSSPSSLHSHTIIATSKGENRLLEKQGYQYEQLDISDKNQVENIFKKHQPDVVMNTAAMTNVDACETHKEECWQANVIAVQNIVDVLTSLKFPAFGRTSPALNSTSPTPVLTRESPPYDPQLIHLSTDFIFDGEKGGPYTEEDKPNPLSYYALSKWEGEKIVQAGKIKWAILRTIIVYGIVDNMSRSNIVLWAKDALSKGQKINVVDDQYRSPTLAEDLAQGCILAALKKAEGIYNVSGKDIMSILELVTRVADFWKLDKSTITPIKSATLNQAARRPARTGFILDKARKVLGYQPHSFEEGLAILDKQLKADT